MKSQIKAVIFDIGGVQYFYNHMLAAKPMSKLINRHVKEIFNIISTESEFTKICESGASEKQYWNYFARKLKLDKIYSKELQKIWNKIFYPNKQLLKKLPLIKKHYKLALMSNMGKGHKKYLVSDKNFCRDFNLTVFSCDVGVRKPNSKIFKIMLKKLNLKPSEVLFIDDNLKNIKSAKKLGIKTIHFKNNSQLSKNKTWKALLK